MARPNRGPYLECGNTGYEIRWCERGRTRRRATGTSDFQQAQKILANFILLTDRERLAPDQAKPLTILEILGDPDTPGPQPSYWHEHVDAKVVNKEIAKFAVKRLIAYFGPMAAKDILPAHIRDFIAKRRSGHFGHKAKDGTIQRDLTVLQSALNHAVRNKRLRSDDVPMIERMPPQPAKDRWLSFDEADRLLAAARQTWNPKRMEWVVEEKLPRVYKFIAIALATGSRRTAILELRRSQVDIDRGMIQFNPAGRAQTSKRRAWVPISDDLRPIMEQILCEADGDELVGRGEIKHPFTHAVQRAGLDGVTPHTLRHTAACWMAQAGVSIVDIAAILGDTIATVERNYLHHCPEHLRGAVNAISFRRAA